MFLSPQVDFSNFLLPSLALLLFPASLLFSSYSSPFLRSLPLTRDVYRSSSVFVLLVDLPLLASADTIPELNRLPHQRPRHQVLNPTSSVYRFPRILLPTPKGVKDENQDKHTQTRPYTHTRKMDAASQGDAACTQSDYPRALLHYTTALLASPRAPAYYIKRSTAFSRLKPADSLAALRDAEVAVLLARERGKRELILAAQMRRAVALFQLGRFGDAGFVFGLVDEKVNGPADKAKAADGKGTGVEDKLMNAMSVANKPAGSKNGFEQELPIWLLKVKGRLGKLAEEGCADEKVVGVTVGEVPEGVQVPTEGELRGQLETLKGGRAVSSQDEIVAGGKESAGAGAGAKTPAPAPAPAHAAVATAAAKVRHEWYQSQDQVVVTLYIKGVLKDRLDVDLKSDSVCAFLA